MKALLMLIPQKDKQIVLSKGRPGTKAVEMNISISKAFN